MHIVLQETQRALFYGPIYCAFALGAFRDEGLDVVLQPSARPDDAVRSVLDGRSDLGWGGPMRVIVEHDRNPGSDLKCFCEVVTRDPFVLVGREPCPDFTPDKLFGLRFGIVREVPTPWCCLQEDLHRAGLDAGKLTLGGDRTMAENADALRAGEVDVVQLLEPAGSALVAQGAGHIWYEAARRGHTSYTAFYALDRVIAARRKEFTLMTRAIYRTQQWMQRASADAIGEAVSGYFPNVAAEKLRAGIERYMRLSIWGPTPHLPRDGFETLRASLLTGRLVATGVAFDAVVDNGIAGEAVASNPPPLSAPSHTG